jgi:hypothetical protein
MFFTIKEKKMKNKLLKSSAFVLALSSSLWNQSEAMMHMTEDYEILSKDIDAALRDTLTRRKSSLRISARQALEAGETRERQLNIETWTLQPDMTLKARGGDYTVSGGTWHTFIVNPSGNRFAEGQSRTFRVDSLEQLGTMWTARESIVSDAVADAYREVTQIVSENKKALTKQLLSLCLAAQLEKRRLARSLVSALLVSGYALKGKGLAGVPRDLVSGVLWTQWCLNKGC